MRGRTPWNKGKTLSAEYRAIMRRAQTGTKKPWISERNRGWRGPAAPNYKDRRSSDPKYRSWLQNGHGRRKKAALGSHTYQEWLVLKSSHFNECLVCQLPEPLIKLTEDHIRPLSKGGTDFISNIQTL